MVKRLTGASSSSIIMASKRKRSNVWDHFQKNEEYASCLVSGCNTKVKHWGNTSHLLKHLQSWHQKEYQQCVQEREANKKKPTKQLSLHEAVSLSQSTLEIQFDINI